MHCSNQQRQAKAIKYKRYETLVHQHFRCTCRAAGDSSAPNCVIHSFTRQKERPCAKKPAWSIVTIWRTDRGHKSGFSDTTKGPLVELQVMRGRDDSQRPPCACADTCSTPSRMGASVGAGAGVVVGSRSPEEESCPGGIRAFVKERRPKREFSSRLSRLKRG